MIINRAINDLQISRNFWLYEFASPDTFEVKVDGQLIALLQTFRDRVKVGFTPNSAYRTPEYNARLEGSSSKSQHMEGRAVDIPRLPGFTVKEMAKIAEEVGFDGIGLYDWGIHVDVRGFKAGWDFRTEKVG